ncbi:MAG: ABC transporter permease [Chloroflexi bacterium]|nr:MAG: branched-chain amino acid ABC transporter permease [Anaerolineaceae bacterium 4572_32.2]RLC99303.1 MAG: ABC transporter permease [Chloroflexota bacterium]
MEAWSQVLSITLFAAAIRAATPILYPALAGIFSERSGVLNIALEGVMLISAFAAVVGSYYTGNPWIGVLCAIVAGMLTSLIHAFMCINMRADQAIVGTGINILGAGLPSFLLLKLFGSQGISPIVERIHEWRVPILADLPIIGPILGEQSPLVYICLLMVPLSWYVLFKTPFGLRLRAVGENPRAAETVGISVYGMRYAGVLISGFLAALGGAFLSVSYLAQFVKLMTAGRGFIGLAAMIFGRWNPWGALFACLLFGFADALQAAAQAANVPIAPQFLRTLPYVLTIIALVGAMGKAEPPAYVAKPYEKA